MADPQSHPSAGNDDDPTIGSSQAAAQRASAVSRLLGRADDDNTVHHSVATLTQTPAVSPTLVAKRQFGDYQLVREIARGGMGVVFEAMQSSLGRTVAVKMILAGEFASDEQIQRFFAEARSVAHLDHPNIVPVYEVGEQSGLHFFSMKLVDGGPLTSQIPRFAGKYIDIATLVEKVARAVHHAHQRGVLHRDLKPGNILIDSRGEPMVTDFGLAKLVADESDVTRSDAVVGTPAYMAPEQARGVRNATTATDIWAIGAILYHLLTGVPPFKAETAVQTLRLLSETEPAPPRQKRATIPRDIETVCLKCLQKDASRRYPTAIALADDLRRFIAGEPVEARPVGRAERLWRWGRRNPVLAITGAVAILALLATVAVLSSAVVLVSASRDQAQRLANTNAEQARTERALRQEAQWESVDRLLDSAIHRHASQDAAVGLLWLARAADEAERVGAADVAQSARQQLAAWSRAVHPLRSAAGFSSREGQTPRRIILSPDGSKAFAIDPGGSATTLHGYDTATAKPLADPIRLPEPPTALAIDPRGGRLLVALSGGTLSWIDAATFKLMNEPVLALAAGSKPTTIAFSGNGDVVAAATNDGTVRLWRTADGTAIGGGFKLTVPENAEAVPPALALSQDGTSVFAAENGSLVKISPTGQRVAEIAAIAGQPIALRFIEDSQQLVAVTPQSLMRVVVGESAESPQLMSLVDVRQNTRIASAAISADGHRVIVSDGGLDARCIDLSDDSQPAAPWHHAGLVESVAVSSDGTVAATGSRDGLIRSFALRQAGGLQATRVGHRSLAAALSPDGGVLAVCGLSASVRLFDPSTLRMAGELSDTGSASSMAFSPGGQSLLVGSQLVASGYWDRRSGNRERVRIPVEGSARTVAFSRDGRRMLISTDEGLTRVFGVDGRQIGREIRHDGYGVAAISPGGQHVAVGNTDATALLFDVDRPQDRAVELRHDRGAIWSVAFSPDGTRLITCGDDHTARVWNVATGQQAGPSLPHQEAVLLAVWSPQGDRIATTGRDRVVRVWDPATGKAITGTLPLSAFGTVLAFSPDARRLAVGTYDGNAAMIDTISGRMIGPPLKLGEEVAAVAFVQGGDKCLVVSQSGLILSVPLQPMPGAAGDLLDWSRRVTGLKLDSSGAAVPISTSR